MKRLLLAFSLCLCSAASLRAQQTDWFPDAHPYRSPLADPFEPRFAGWLISTDLLPNATAGAERARFMFPPYDPAQREVQAAVTFGRTVPIVSFVRPGHTLTIGGQFSVNGRFRIERASRDDLGQDWMVALPIEVAAGRVSGRARLLHRSSHLGDELTHETGAQRIEFGGDGLDFALAVAPVPALRVYGSANWIFHSNTEQETILAFIGRRDRLVTNVGADVATYPWKAGRLGFVAGVDAQNAERTNWRTSLSSIAGLAVKTERRAARLVVRTHFGPSTMGEFFLTNEEYWGLELVLDW